MEHLNEDKYKRAKKKVEDLKGFYIHFMVYLVVNAFILVNIYNHTDDFWQWPHFVTLAAWGIGLGFHAVKTFDYNPFFGKNWEAKQIEKYMEEDKKEIDKYR
ncbi:MAG: 2TM domain-containing protein [Bacteroidota bacterium]